MRGAMASSCIFSAVIGLARKAVLPLKKCPKGRWRSCLRQPAASPALTRVRFSTPPTASRPPQCPQRQGRPPVNSSNFLRRTAVPRQRPALCLEGYGLAPAHGHLEGASASRPPGRGAPPTATSLRRKVLRRECGGRFDDQVTMPQLVKPQSRAFPPRQRCRFIPPVTIEACSLCSLSMDLNGVFGTGP